ncbi:hypothetical protein Tco_0797435 [Tanacetum coccineum]
MVVFKVLKNQLQQFITMQISMDSDDQKTNHFFSEYTLCDARMFQNILISLMDSIEKAIAERGLYKRVHDSRVNERAVQTRKGMISKDALETDNNVAGASYDKDNITEVQSSNNEMFAKILMKTTNDSEMLEKTKPDHKNLTEENVLLKKEIETYKERVQDFNEKQDIKKLEQEKEELQDQVLKIKNATKAFKQDEDKYVNKILQLETKNKDLENTVCKMGKSGQTLCMLTNEQSLYRENKRKMGLGYTDPCPFGQAIACHPKLYDADVLGLHYVKPDVHDIVEIINAVEESQVKMKEKQFQFNYENMNSLYDTFVPQTKLSSEQDFFLDPSTFTVSFELSLDESDVPPKEMPNEGKLLKLFVKLDNKIQQLVTFNLDFYTDKHINVDQQRIQQLFSHKVVLISRSLNECSTIIQQEITEEVKEMLDIFESMEIKVDRTSKKNEILQNKIDQILEANIANDVQNLIMQSYVEIKNNKEIERFSKESKDSEKFCNDVVEVKEKLSKQIVQLEKDFAKLEAQSIAFEIALQHKTQENKYLKTIKKENENFMASLQIENAHLKQTYKDLFESVQSLRVETIQCDEVKIKFDFDKIETQNIELEHQSRVQTKPSNVTQNEAENLKSQLFEFAETKFNNILGKIELLKKNQFDSFSSLNVDCNSSDLEKESGEKKNIFESETCVFQIKIVELEKTLAKQTKENSDLLRKIDNLENAFADEVKRLTTEKLTAFDKENYDFGSKVTHLRKIIAQKTIDFDDVKLKLSNRTAKFEEYFKKLENTKVVLERQLARKADDSKAEKD